MKYYIDECIIVNGETLDRGFVLDTENRVVEWTEPLPGGQTRIFPVSECVYDDAERTPVSVEDGELIGVPTDEYFAQF